jgi:hypothetical protein
MEPQFFCSACGCEHNDPADALLGHLVICLDCAMVREFCVYTDGMTVVKIPIAA